MELREVLATINARVGIKCRQVYFAYKSAIPIEDDKIAPDRVPTRPDHLGGGFLDNGQVAQCGHAQDLRGSIIELGTIDCHDVHVGDPLRDE